ncbi:MAG: DUF3368 domain-containing protein [Gammaproteobacteria bacterium]|nr:DUF3368 domain-containing protein [Gammaproteobacteria bacterium]
MIVVADTSPIINLAAIGQLDLLHRLYGTLWIPDAVYREIAETGAGEPGSAEVQSLDWIERHSARRLDLVTALRLELDPGEAEAIALAIENKSDLLLIDERRGRHIAARFDLKMLGLLGVLVEARRTGLIPSVSPLLSELSRAAGFYMTPELINRVKAACGEA